ncbi:MAG: Nif11 family protein, partial [Gemmatimonadetes bacterium]|nr:Nif11 family protein [Gemmatimonadota bacterium]
SVAAFLKKALEDAELRKELVELAGRHGYTFTVDELCEKELESVAGGFLKLDSTIEYKVETTPIIKPLSGSTFYKL